MSLKRKYILDTIQEIKTLLKADANHENKTIYLKKDDTLIGFHSQKERTESGFLQIEGRCDAYDQNWKHLGTVYSFCNSVEEEIVELKKDGWIEVKRCQMCRFGCKHTLPSSCAGKGFVVVS